MLKYLLLPLLVYSCSSKKVTDTSVSDASKSNTYMTDNSNSANQETRIKSIKYSSYNRYADKLVPYCERILTYSNDFQRMEYVELQKGNEIFEKHIVKFTDDKLMSVFSLFDGTEFNHAYEYNQFGDLSTYRSSNDSYFNEQVYEYEDRKLIKLSTYDTRDSTNKILLSEEKFIFDTLNNSMNRVYKGQSETRSAQYTYNSKGQIISKSQPYKKYTVEYVGDSIININLAQDVEPYASTTTTTIKYGANGLLSEIVKTQEWEKEITYMYYDDNNNISRTLFIRELKDGRRDYVKCEIGPYNVKSKMIFPSWDVSGGLFCNRGYDNVLDEALGEKRLYNGVPNKQNRLIKSIPDYYVMYNSKDSINWAPELRFDYTFVTTEKLK